MYADRKGNNTSSAKKIYTRKRTINADSTGRTTLDCASIRTPACECVLVSIVPNSSEEVGKVRCCHLQTVKSLPPNDAHIFLVIAQQLALCQSDYDHAPTQAAFTDSHHVVYADDLRLQPS